MAEEEYFGPALPPALVARPSSPSKTIGPTLPAKLRTQIAQRQYDDSSSEEEFSGTIGPLPDGEQKTREQILLEERSLELRMASIQELPAPSDAKTREEWMLELPEVRKVPDMGLTARQFRKNAGPDLSDRSSWTDTPEMKKKKEQEQYEGGGKREKKSKSSHKEKHKKKRHEEPYQKSLLELHTEKLKKEKKKKKKDDEKPERRRFDRDVDLKANQLDDAKKKAMLKRTQGFETRFSSDKSHFL